jgi:hypothetical protein
MTIWTFLGTYYSIELFATKLLHTSFHRNIYKYRKDLYRLILILVSYFIKKKNLVDPRLYNIQDAAEITPTFQRGFTNKWYEVSPKNFYFPNADIKTFFFTVGSKNYIVQMVAVTADTHLEPFFLNGLL